MFELPDFDSLCNCTYTTTSGKNVKVDIAALFKLMENIPEVPKIYRMDISLFVGPCLPKNSIIMSAVPNKYNVKNEEKNG